MVINAGLRFDGVNYNTKIWSNDFGEATPERPWFWSDCGLDGLCTDSDFYPESGADFGEDDGYYQSLGNGIWNFGEIFTDELDGGEEPCSGPYQTDSCGDTWEDFDDDGVFDDNEVFTPAIHDFVGNGIWDEDEDFIDSNENDQWDNEDVYLPSGLNYLKPQLIGFSWGYTSTTTQSLSFSFEVDQISYNNHLNLDDFYKWKFGFEYLTQLGTPVRGGLVYSTSPVNSLPATTMFTFGSGKKIGNILIDISGTYQLYTYKYPDLFVVENDVRPNYYDTIRDSQLNLSLSVSYSF